MFRTMRQHRILRRKQKFDGITDPYYMPGNASDYTGNKVVGYKIK